MNNLKFSDVDLVNANGISFFMFVNDLAYKQLPDSTKSYSVQQHVTDSKAGKYRNQDWKKRLTNDCIGAVFAKIMENYWARGLDFFIIDVGAQYGNFSLSLAKYIKGTGHTNKIYAFDCGIAGKLTDYNIKLNQLSDIIKFQYKAISNASIPQIVYYDSQHSEDNHIVRRKFVNLHSYVVDGTTLDDYFIQIYNSYEDSHKKNLIIKIDAQGVEPLIFEGMQKILKHARPNIIFEFVPWVCESLKDPLEFLYEMPQEYVFINLDDGKKTLTKIERKDLSNFVKKISTDTPPYTDLLMLRKDASEIDADIFLKELSQQLLEIRR